MEEAGTRELLSRMVDGSLDPPFSSLSDLPPALEGPQLLREEMLMVVGRSTRCEARMRSRCRSSSNRSSPCSGGVLPQGAHGGAGAGLGWSLNIAFGEQPHSAAPGGGAAGFAVTHLPAHGAGRGAGAHRRAFAPPIFLDLCVAWRRGPAFHGQSGAAGFSIVPGLARGWPCQGPPPAVTALHKTPPTGGVFHVGADSPGITSGTGDPACSPWWRGENLLRGCALPAAGTRSATGMPAIPSPSSCARVVGHQAQGLDLQGLCSISAQMV